MGNNKIVKSLMFKILLLIIVLIVLPILIAGYVLKSQITDALTQMAQERAVSASYATTNLIGKFEDSLKSVLQSNSHWEDYRLAVQNKDVVWIEESVNVGTEIIPNLHFISTADLQGNVISQAGDVKEFTGKLSRPEIIQKLQNNDSFSGLMQTSKGLAIIVASNVTDEVGTAPATGVVIFGRILDDAALKEIKKSLQDDIGILTTTGTMLTTSQVIGEQALSPYIKQNKDDLKEFSLVHSDAGESAVMVTTLKDFTNQTIGVLQIVEPQQVSTEVKNNITTIYVIIIVLFAIVLILLATLVYKIVVKPVHELAEFAEDVAEGDLTLVVREKMLHRTDELGKLASSIDIMIRNFRHLIQEVTETIEHVATSSRELTASSESTMNATNQIVSAVTEVANGADTQVQNAVDTSRVIDEMSLRKCNVLRTQ